MRVPVDGGPARDQPAAIDSIDEDGLLTGLYAAPHRPDARAQSAFWISSILFADTAAPV